MLKTSQETITHCEYDNCNNNSDLIKIFHDPETDKDLCSKHYPNCQNCNEQHIIDNMHEKDGDYYCQNCFDQEFMTCPNCEKTIESNEYLAPTLRNRYYQKDGGCIHCCQICDNCGRVTDKDSTYSDDNGGSYCENCYSDLFSNCEECNDSINRDDAIYVEDVGDFCRSCYNNLYEKCEDCHKDILRSEAEAFNYKNYCHDCFQQKFKEYYKTESENFKNFSYTKKDKYLNFLSKLLPISVKDLKSKHPSLAAGLQDLISFSKGKTLTSEIVDEYRNKLMPEEFPVNYGLWEGLQRSLDESPEEIVQPQLVVNILASKNMLNILKAKPALYDLFDKINTLSKQSEHPYIKDQIGWARVELDPNRKYLLVDEIQSDHSNAAFRIKNENSYDINKIRNQLKTSYKLDEDGLKLLISEYQNLLKDFPNIASEAVANFARKNNIPKIFWHTYESGMKLKNNQPPRSLYESVPKENLYTPSTEKPFSLEGDFFERSANNKNYLRKFARYLFLKYLT